ncbi:MAG: DUF1223 domain-containing protein [Gammaproteobacteria bacterium]|nr:DUF1223 domain-containing protein [Gammaproteobacteria bacterium]
MSIKRAAKRAINLSRVFCLSVVFMSVGAVAEQKISVQSASTVTPLLELYTSEGCSSCPRADEWLGKLGAALDADFHALPLAFHVDYWNRLGWIDPFAKAEFTKRQEMIAMDNRQSTLYTPQFVISGKDAKGSNNLIEQVYFSNTQAAKLSIELHVTSEQSNQIQAEVLVNNMNIDGAAKLYVAVFENDLVNEIPAGENKGRTLHHEFVVRYWSHPQGLSLDKNEHQKTIEIPLGDEWENQNLGVAAVVIDDEDGETLQSVSTSIKTLFES